MEKMRDSIDFKNMDIAALFRKLLLPTVLGMIFSALFVITDGIFVGKGIGSDALAAVNFNAERYLFRLGINKNAVGDVGVIAAVLAHSAGSAGLGYLSIFCGKVKLNALGRHKLSFVYRFACQQHFRSCL